MINRGWVKKLFKEMDAWLGEGIIDPRQADKIRDRYSKQLEYNRLVSSVFVLGSILIGLGILLFIASNWQYMGRMVKVGLISFFIVVFNLGGYYFRYERKSYPKLGESLLFLGAICYGAGIWLIAQIFQIPYNYAHGLLFWLLGIVPVVFLLHSRTILALASLLLPVWLGVVIANDPSRINYPYFLLLAIIIWLAYRERQRTSLFFGILSVCIWLPHYLSVRLGELHDFSLGVQLLYGNAYNAYGFLLYSLGMFHKGNKNFSRFSSLYKLLALILLFLSNYSFTFAHHYGDTLRSSAVSSSAALLMYLCYLLAAMFSLRYVYAFQGSEENTEAKIILSCLVAQIMLTYSGTWGGVAISASYNILLFIEVIAFLYLGYLLREENIFRLSLYLFALDVLTRYFDVFWKIMQRSLFFLLGGLLLVLGGTYMEKKRKAIEAKMREARAERAE